MSCYQIQSLKDSVQTSPFDIKSVCMFVWMCAKKTAYKNHVEVELGCDNKISLSEFI